MLQAASPWNPESERWGQRKINKITPAVESVRKLGPLKSHFLKHIWIIAILQLKKISGTLEKQKHSLFQIKEKVKH